MADLTVVLGGGSGLGAEVARQLVADGRRVRGVTRTGRGIPVGVENRRADALDKAALIEACKNASIIHLATNVPYPDWTTMFPVMVDHALAAAERSGAKLVFADNLYCYGPLAAPDLPFDEQTPMRPVGPKEKMRAELRRTLLETHASGRARVTIGGISDYYGPGARMSLPGELVLEPLAKGRRPMWFSPLALRHTFAYSLDTARALVVLGDDPRSDGRVWHTPAAEALPVADFIALAGEASGRVRKPMRLPTVTTKLIERFDHRLRGYSEMEHQRSNPWIVDHSAFDQTFSDFKIAGHREAMAHTIAWYRAQ